MVPKFDPSKVKLKKVSEGSRPAYIKEKAQTSKETNSTSLI